MKYSPTTHPLMSDGEITYWDAISNTKLTNRELATLYAIVEAGPLDDGSIPSTTARNELLNKLVAGYRIVTRVIVKGQDGYTAATYVGRDLYKAQYLCDPEDSTMAEAKAGRLARIVINRAKS